MIALVAVLVAALFTSPLQTWIAQTVLDRQPGLQSSVGEVSAGFNEIKFTDLNLEMNGAVLTVPSLQASLPVKSAAWDHRLMVRSLVAKGWTLDLSNLPESHDAAPGTAAAPAGGDATKSEAQAVKSAAREVEQVFRGLLGGWKSPCDVALDGVELEGDVLVALSPESVPIRVHVVLKGGGMAAGKDGTFALDALAADPSHGLDTIAAHGPITVGMSSPRALNRVEIKVDLTAQGRSWSGGFAGSVELAATRNADGAAVTFDLRRDQRHLATVQAHASADQRVVGTWKVNARDTDLAPFAPQVPLPQLTIDGEGRFEADGTFAQVRVLGALETGIDHLERLNPALAHFEGVGLVARFEVISRGRTLRVEALDAALIGTRPLLTVRALQPFEIELGGGNLQVADPTRDWLEASVEGMLVDRLPGLTGKFDFTGGDVTGKFVLRAEKNGISVRPRTPLVATGVTVEHAGRVLGKNLDLSLALQADFGPEGWQMKAAPLAVGSAGRRLATVTATASRPAGADQAVTLSGTWNADLEALAVQPAAAALAGTGASAASGEFTATLDSGMEVDGKLSIIGNDPTHSLTANVHLDSAAQGVIEFKVPVTLTLGKDVSVFSAEGNWSRGERGVRLSGRVTSEDADLDHLRLLAAATGWSRAFGGFSDSAGSVTAAIPRDQKPFWLGWSGEVTLAFERLHSGGKVYPGVGATFDLDESSIALKRAWFGQAAGDLPQVEGALSFDGTAEFPYRLKATAAVSDIDGVPLLGTLAKGEDPVLEGHFSVAATVTGDGRTLDDVVRRARQEFHVTGKGGIIRLLKTSVSDALPDEPPAPVADAAGKVGSWVGWLAGVKKDSLGSDEKKVSRNTEAVLNLTSQIGEIGYDQISVTATRGQDQTIKLVAIDLTSRDERLTGSGQITGDTGLALGARPLTMELKLGVRGNAAALLSQTGLLTSKNDELGYLQLVRALHFGGTLQNPDVTDWHDLLAKAALPPAPAKPGKK